MGTRLRSVELTRCARSSQVVVLGASGGRRHCPAGGRVLSKTLISVAATGRSQMTRIVIGVMGTSKTK